ncbi:MAG: P27 family phage terminase small subunit [Betaproteobacteria bacterium]|nr:P27 family phage terminase small subunit [Betaproteobacteria bacterium]NCV59648.1 P27 family phage terminase small subunit [Betaproteobacteria bacterium]NCW99646.1 P27 family phage terminase small subunit [Betaproteobacteria bacterium]NCX13083.1 P27 family phage terminase small subunit [Betaproteobacteria bacterium]NCX63296.1 P27 family phage terminase small subunit [Betaproteobacteria bacterium]
MATTAVASSICSPLCVMYLTTDSIDSGLLKIVRIWASRGLLRKLDVYLLAAWCNAAYRYEYNMRLAAKSDVIPVRGAKLAGLDPKDRPVMHNPFSTAARAYLKDMTMLAAELGFTPSSRARLGATESAVSSREDPWEQIAG